MIYATKFFFEITCTVQIKLKNLIHGTSLKLDTTLEPGSFNNLLLTMELNSVLHM